MGDIGDRTGGLVSLGELARPVTHGLGKTTDMAWRENRRHGFSRTLPHLTLGGQQTVAQQGRSTRWRMADIG